jgi:hypothetical protein
VKVSAKSILNEKSEKNERMKNERKKEEIRRRDRTQ